MGLFWGGLFYKLIPIYIGFLEEIYFFCLV